MKKITILISLLGILIGLSSCGETARYASPMFYDGYYFMTGDSNCVYARKVKADVVECGNKDQMPTGEHRKAMTNQQLQMYRHNQAMNQRQRIADKESYDRSQESFDRSMDSINRDTDRLMKSIQGMNNCAGAFC
jgi:hypothetical protein